MKSVTKNSSQQQNPVYVLLLNEVRVRLKFVFQTCFDFKVSNKRSCYCLQWGQINQRYFLWFRRFLSTMFSLSRILDLLLSEAEVSAMPKLMIRSLQQSTFKLKKPKTLFHPLPVSDLMSVMSCLFSELFWNTYIT